MSYVRSRRRARAPHALGANRTVYEVVRTAMEKVMHGETHPGMTVTPIPSKNPGMTVTPINGLGAIPMMARQRRRPQKVLHHRQWSSLGATAIEYTPTIMLPSPPPPPPPPAPRKQQRAMHGALGDRIDDCEAAAPAQTAQLDAWTNDLNMNWHPTGYYTPVDVLTVIGAVTQMTSGVRDAIVSAQQSALTTQGGILAQAVDDLNAIGNRALDYIDAAHQAQAQGSDVAVDAAGLRRWVIDAFGASSSATQAAYIANCVTPSTLDMLAITVLSWGNAAYTAAKALVGLAKQLVNKAVAVFDLVSWLVTWGPWIGVGVGALWVYKTYGHDTHSP